MPRCTWRHAERRSRSGRRIHGLCEDPAVTATVTGPIRVFLVDDQQMVRAGFRMLVESQDDMVVVGEAGDGGEALEQLAVTATDVVLMDVRMPRMDGVEATVTPAGDAGTAAGDRADHLRPRRIRLRRDPRRARRRSCSRTRPARPAGSDPFGGGRRRGRRARAPPDACSTTSPRCPTRGGRLATPAGRPHRARARGADPDRPGPHQHRDRRRPRRRRDDGEDPRRPPPRQDGLARPGAARGARLRVRPREP